MANGVENKHTRTLSMTAPSTMRVIEGHWDSSQSQVDAYKAMRHRTVQAAPPQAVRPDFFADSLSDGIDGAA